jgi:gliding motility-associated lipoprotein GldH
MTLRAQSILFLSVLMSLLSSCSFDAIFDENVRLEKAQWAQNEAIRFNVNIKDSLSVYDFYVNFRNTSDYRFQNLYVFLTTRFPNNNVTRDTIEFILADNTGKWLGKGWGNLKENDILLKSGLNFPLTGEYQFLFEHAMRTDTLQGIANFGIRIENSN